MKIDTSFKPTGTTGTSSRPRTVAVDKSGKAGATEVTLSAASSQMAGAMSGAPIDGARIAEIKLAIAEGRFQINAEAIADGLIDTARGLLQAQRKA